jgi:hypothetical protein
MRLLKIAIFVFAMSLMAATLRADMPPEPGSTRVYTDLVLDAQDDVRDYRFFVWYGSRLEEVKLEKGQRSTIKAKGGAYRWATVYAVPKKSLPGLGDDLDEEKLTTLQSKLSSHSIAGLIELLSLDFVRDVPTAAAGNYGSVEYRLEKNGDAVVASLVPVNMNKSGGDGPSFGVNDVRKTISPIGWAVIVVGGLAILGLVGFGITKLGRRNLQ